jgi:hypothetical protein
MQHALIRQILRQRHAGQAPGISGHDIGHVIIRPTGGEAEAGFRNQAQRMA